MATGGGFLPVSQCTYDLDIFSNLPIDGGDGPPRRRWGRYAPRTPSAAGPATN